MKNRIELAKLFAENLFTKGAEIGVWDGRYSEILLEQIPDISILYSIDSWTNDSGMNKNPWDSDVALAKTVRRLLKFDTVSKIIIEKSIEASRYFPQEWFDFVFIDADHRYESVKQDIEVWAPKVRHGGIVSGHDYYVTKQGNDGVVRAVDEYIKKYNYKLLTTDWDKENPIEDDRQPCWYFYKV